MICVTSISKIKLDAVQDALRNIGVSADVVGVKAASDVNEQPMNDETLQGARNRVAQARIARPDADLYISIENGIYTCASGYEDKAVVLAVDAAGIEHIAVSQEVSFPVTMVDIARQRGFATTTVGQIMQEQGLIKNNADPHLDLIGKSRADILRETIVGLFRQMGLSDNPKFNRPTGDLLTTGVNHTL